MIPKSGDGIGQSPRQRGDRASITDWLQNEICEVFSREDVFSTSAARSETISEGRPSDGLAGCATTEAVGGPHLRAARAILGWSRSDLARISGLSVATIRRFEGTARLPGGRDVRVVLFALWTGGVRFHVMRNGTIVVVDET